MRPAGRSRLTYPTLPDADSSPRRGRLLIACTDRPGIVAAVSRSLFDLGANIVHSDQHSTAPEDGAFFMRVEFDLPDLDRRGPELEASFDALGNRFGMDWRLAYAHRRKRLALFVSREDHCLLELLWQQRAGDLQAEIAMVISNHTALAGTAANFGIPYHHIPVERGHHADAEGRHLALLEGQVDTVVLARYMQILSAEFVRRWGANTINIHHSFLPAFVGSRPYDQAFQRGVKLIGATAHYVTEELDAGPIIEQDVARVDHGDTVEDLKRIGRSIERVVLARAVAWHAEDRVLVHDNKTVVFN